MNDTEQQQLEAHSKATSAFIDLANTLSKEDGQDMKLVSAALMAASGIYATFVAAGNEGFLAPGGIEKVATVYKNNLTYIQERKQEEIQAQGKTPRRVGVPEERAADAKENN